MTKPRAALTELEGAILGVLRRAPGLTPYAVRKVFLHSRSAEWSGSAGAVYPAIARLARERLLRATAGDDARGTVTYVLSAKGAAAHDRWLGDVARATSPGIDPFRTRAALWLHLPGRARKALLRKLERETRRQREAMIATPPDGDEGEAITGQLLLGLLDLRLVWLKAMLDA